MRHFLLILLLALVPSAASALQVTSISPSTATAGESVALTGGPFTQDVRVRLGETSLVPDSLEENRLTFTVPDLAPGDYLLQVQKGATGAPRQVTTMRIIPPVPEVTTVTPESLDLCSIQHGVGVRVEGRFPAGTRLLLDNTVVAAANALQEALSFTAPPLKSGLHQIEAVGPDGRKSLPHPLVVEGVPRIFSVQQGEQDVLSYEVVVSGENFLFESLLVVNDIPVNSPRVTPGTEILPPQLLPRKDYVRYVDCNTLIYVRHPLTSEPNTVTLQVVNPGGEQSRVYRTEIP